METNSHATAFSSNRTFPLSLALSIALSIMLWRSDQAIDKADDKVFPYPGLSQCHSSQTRIPEISGGCDVLFLSAPPAAP